MKDKTHKKEKINKIDFSKIDYGSILFGVGILISLIAGLFSLDSNTAKIVVGTTIIIGIAVGLLNITKEETVPFLLSSVVMLMLLGPFLGVITQQFLTNYVTTGKILVQMYTYLISLIAPGALIVALKTIFLTAKDEK